MEDHNVGAAVLQREGFFMHSQCAHSDQLAAHPNSFILVPLAVSGVPTLLHHT